MTLFITDTSIRSDLTRHEATRTVAAAEDYWRVSWLPDRTLSEAEAEAAMELAEIVAEGRDDKGTTNFAYFTWERIAELTGQLGLQGLQAVAILEEWPTSRTDKEGK